MKKIAFLFWGLSRSLIHTHEGINKNLVDVFKLKDYEVTIFQHFYILLDCYENKRSKEKSCELDFSQYRLLNSNFFEFDIQEQVKKKLKLKNYREMGNPWSVKDYQTLDNFILASYSKMRVTRMMEISDIKFDIVFYVRPDLEILQPFPLDKMEYIFENKQNVQEAQSSQQIQSSIVPFSPAGPPRLGDPPGPGNHRQTLVPCVQSLFHGQAITENYHTSHSDGILNSILNIIIIPNFHLFGKYNINDRMAICTFSNYKAFGYTFENMLSDSKKMKLHAETYVGYNFKKYHIDVRYIDFYFNRVRADGRVTNDYDYISIENKQQEKHRDKETSSFE